MAQLVGIAIALALTWLLARVIWLPFYFGIFFYLIAGLLVGAISFRVARSVRPLRTPRLVQGVVLMTLVAMGASVTWEYRNIAATVADPPRFARARQSLQASGRSVGPVQEEATQAFRTYLRNDYSPGGVLGYAQWAIDKGQVRLVVLDGFADEASIPHRGIAWLLRTTIAGVLFAAGLWSQYESLRSATATSNILAPGEEAEDA